MTTTSTTAYRYTRNADTVRVERVTYPAGQCAAPREAAPFVLAGGSAIVADGDAAAMRCALAKAGKAVTP